MKRLDQVRQKMRFKHDSYATEKCYVAWIERFIRFHGRGTVWRHPAEMGPARSRRSSRTWPWTGTFR